MQQTITGQVFTAASDEWAGAVVEIQFDNDADARPDSPSVTALTGSDGTFTATVYNNSSEVRTALLRLPDDSTFAIEVDPEQSEIAAGTLIAFSQASRPRLSGQAASGGGGVVTVADAAARFALTGLGRLATVYQEDNGFYYQVVDPAQLNDPAGWSALPKVYSANFYIDGTPEVVVTRQDNQTGVGVTLSYNNTGIVDVAADAPLFNEYSQIWCQLPGDTGSPITTTMRGFQATNCQICGFDDGTLANDIFGNGTNSTTALKIEVYPEPD